MKKEIWRTKHEQDAYTDQTGLKHWGTVVYEQIVVEFTGDTFDQFEYYAEKKYDSGMVFKDEKGRIYLRYQNLVDYTGGCVYVLVYDPMWEIAELIDIQVLRDDDPPRRFYPARKNPTGYVYPDGSGPIKPLLTDE